MSDIEITVTGDSEEIIKAIFKLRDDFSKVRLTESPLDKLTIHYTCTDESKVLRFIHKNNEGEEIQSPPVKAFSISFQTTFFPTPKSVACMIGNETVRIVGRGGEKARRIVFARFKKQGLAVPPAIYKEAMNEIRLGLPLGSIEIKGDKKTRDVADALGIQPQSVRYHLRNLLSEGVDIGNGNTWEWKEFERICNLIKPRLGAHGRRA
jgi:hypothetical protein